MKNKQTKKKSFRTGTDCKTSINFKFYQTDTLIFFLKLSPGQTLLLLLLLLFLLFILLLP